MPTLVLQGATVSVYTSQEVDALIAGLGVAALESRVAALEDSVAALQTTQSDLSTQIAALVTALASKVEGLNGLKKFWVGTAAELSAVNPIEADAAYIAID